MTALHEIRSKNSASTGSYAEVETRAANLNIPLSAHIELTSKCNLKCVHCYLASKRNKKELSTDEFKTLFSALAELGTLYLALSGGEIFVRPDFLTLARFARQKNFALRLFTNGTLINEKIARQIAELYPALVEISLYSLSDKIHDQITTVSGSHQKTMAAIEFLTRQNINLVLKTVVMQQNYAGVADVEAYAKQIGAIFRADPVISPREDGSKAPVNYRINNEKLSHFFCNANYNWQLHYHKPEEPLCNAGRALISINAFGDVFPCVRIQNCAGNIRENSVYNIWHHSGVMSELRALTWGKLDRCLQCENLPFCSPCPGLSLLEHDDIRVPARECCRQAEIRKNSIQINFS